MRRLRRGNHQYLPGWMSRFRSSSFKYQYNWCQCNEKHIVELEGRIVGQFKLWLGSLIFVDVMVIVPQSRNVVFIESIDDVTVADKKTRIMIGFDEMGKFEKRVHYESGSKSSDWQWVKGIGNNQLHDQGTETFGFEFSMEPIFKATEQHKDTEKVFWRSGHDGASPEYSAMDAFRQHTGSKLVLVSDDSDYALAWCCQFHWRGKSGTAWQGLRLDRHLALVQNEKGCPPFLPEKK